MNKIMILKGGSPAQHKLGDIGRTNDDFIRVNDETETHYIGNFEEGFGFINVKFQKEDCRTLTEEEKTKLNGSWYSINENPLYKIYVDAEGNVINGKCIMKNGVIEKVTDIDGFTKHPEFAGLNISFAEDIQIGKSLVMMTDSGNIRTSSVLQLDIKDNLYIVHTRNSIYFISIGGK